MAARLFPPNPGDDASTSRENENATHLTALTHLACRAETLIANLLHASDLADDTFGLRLHPERADVLFDFGYLKDVDGFEEDISTSPSLSRTDRTCRQSCQSNVAKVFSHFANVVRFRDDFVDFTNAFDDDARRAQTVYPYGTDTEYRGDSSDEDDSDANALDFTREFTVHTLPLFSAADDARVDVKLDSKTKLQKQSNDPAIDSLLLETCSSFAYMLLIVHERFDWRFRERVCIAHLRWSSQSKLKVDTFDEVVDLCRGESENLESRASSKYPAHVFAKFQLPKRVVQYVVNRYRRVESVGMLSNDPRNNTEQVWFRDDEEEYSEDDYDSHVDSISTWRARQMCLVLLFAPDVLSNDFSAMRDVVDTHFPETFVISVGAGHVVDLSTAWSEFHAARRALGNAKGWVESAEEESGGTIDGLENSSGTLNNRSSFFTSNSRQISAARLVKRRAFRLTELSTRVRDRLFEIDEKNDGDEESNASRVACAFEQHLALVTHTNANIQWLLTHAHAVDSQFRNIFSTHAPDPSFVMDTLLAVSKFELVLERSVKLAERTKQGRWSRAIRNAVFSVKALSGCIEDEEETYGVDEVNKQSSKDTHDAATPSATPITTPVATPTKLNLSTPKTPKHTTQRARYDRIKGRMEALSDTVELKNATHQAREVLSIARSLERAEESEADKMRRGETADDAAVASTRRNARAHATSLFECLQTMHHCVSLDSKSVTRLTRVTDMSYASGLLQEHVPTLKSKLITDPGRFTDLFAAFLEKCNSAVETKLVRFDGIGVDCDEDDDFRDVDCMHDTRMRKQSNCKQSKQSLSNWRAVSAYYSDEVISFAASVFDACAERTFAILDEIVKDDEPEYSYDDEYVFDENLESENDRLQLVEALHEVSTLVEGVLSLPPVRIGVQILNSVDVLKTGLRKQLRHKIAGCFDETLRFTVLETSVFGGVTERPCTSTEFYEQLVKLQQKTKKLDSVFRRAVRYFSNVDLGINAVDEETNEVLSYFVYTERDVFFVRHGGGDRLGYESSDAISDKLAQLLFSQRSEKEKDSSDVSYFSPLDLKGPCTCVGRLVEGLLRHTDPGTSRFVDHAIGWVNTHTNGFNETSLGPRTMKVLFKTFGPVGIAGVQKLIDDQTIKQLNEVTELIVEEVITKDGALWSVTDSVAWVLHSDSFGTEYSYGDDSDDGKIHLASAVEALRSSPVFTEIRSACLSIGHQKLLHETLFVAYNREVRVNGGVLHGMVESVALGGSSDYTSDSQFPEPKKQNSEREKIVSSRVAAFLHLFTLSELKSFYHDDVKGVLMPKNAHVTPDATPLIIGITEVLEALDKGKREKTAVGPVTSRYLELLTKHLTKCVIDRGEALQESIQLQKSNPVQFVFENVKQVMDELAPGMENAFVKNENEKIGSKTMASWIEALCVTLKIPREFLYKHAPRHIVDNAGVDEY